MTVGKVILKDKMVGGICLLKVIKKDGTLEEYNEQKIINAVNKSAGRVPCTLSANDYGNICNKVLRKLNLKILTMKRSQ